MLKVESETTKIEVQLPMDFFARTTTEGYHPIMSHGQVYESIRKFLHGELSKCGWPQRVLFRLRGSIVRLFVDDPILPLVSGWELENLMEFLLHARVLHIGLLRENRTNSQWMSTGQQFMKWSNGIEWKKSIAESQSSRYQIGC
ncbi:MAG: hypothetical protein KDB75_08170 [Flavobacteriales bacterium]|nr:hypothetical protein [Flavobacteriales bacterium]